MPVRHEVGHWKVCFAMAAAHYASHLQHQKAWQTVRRSIPFQTLQTQGSSTVAPPPPVERFCKMGRLGFVGVLHASYMRLTCVLGRILALGTHCALLLDKVLPKEPLGTALPNAPKFRSPKLP